MKNEVYLIKNVEEYGKLISYCIQNDISVFRTYFDTREVDSICYRIDYEQKRCFYSCKNYWIDNGYEIVVPIFKLDIFGKYFIANSVVTTGFFEDVIHKFGKTSQLIVAIEEFSELIKELCKTFRSPSNVENIVDEIVDCKIMLEQLQLIFDIRDFKIFDRYVVKINRLKGMLD
jgi:hypothetical protein